MARVDFFYWKDKNKFCICKGQEKCDKFFYIDLNDLTVHGFSGREVKKIPAGYTFALRSERYYGENCFYRNFEDLLAKTFYRFLLHIFEQKQAEQYAPVFPNLERVIMALYPQGFYFHHEYSWVGNLKRFQEEIDKNNVTFGEVIEQLKETSKNWGEWDKHEVDGKIGVSMYDVYAIAKTISDTKRYGKYKDLFSEYDREFIVNLITELENRELWDKYEKTVIEWLNHPQVVSCFKLGLLRSFDFERQLVRAISHANMMERKIEKGVPFFQWHVIERDFEAIQDELKQKTLTRTQRDDFAFEDDNFIAIVPKTMEEFTNEGAEMGNCIGSAWMGSSYGNYPEEGRMSRGAVFVRRKNDPTKAFVDCDFYLETGEIDQFYGKGNYRVCQDNDLLIFKKALQEHLFAIIKATE